MIDTCVTVYKLKKFIPPDSSCYDELFRDISKHQEVRARRSKDISKILLKERISGKSISDSQESEPYLDINAQEGGDFDLRYAENLPKNCGLNVIWFEGETSGNEYVKKVDCRKQWCPICGGKNGKVHKSRMHSILSRVNPNLFNIRQFVFTIPEILRPVFQDREKLSELFSMSKQVIEKYFGSPDFDKKGHIKKYHLEKPVIAYLHAFGDQAPGVFKPHINIHILEAKTEKLKLSDSILQSIKKSWLKKLKKYEASLEVVDVQYSFITKKGKFLHKLKYMCRPWSKEDFDNIQDESLKRLMVLDLSGFQYLRYWGKLSNRTYKDEMDLSEIKQECESKIEEKLIQRSNVTPMNFESYKHILTEIDEGFYLVTRRGQGNEPENKKENAAAE